SVQRDREDHERGAVAPQHRAPALHRHPEQPLGLHHRGAVRALAEPLDRPVLHSGGRPLQPQLPPGVAAGGPPRHRPPLTPPPLDAQESTRKLFTPLPLDGIVYLAKTTWPISTVFRLYLENLNWVPNAQTASGPTPRIAPDFADFRRGVDA